MAEGKDFFESDIDELVPKRSRRTGAFNRKWLLVALATVVVLVAGGVLAWLFARWGGSSETRVPELIGRELGDVQEELRGVGLEPWVEGWVFSHEYGDGTVVEQVPEPGSTVEKGERVELVVSRGERMGEEDVYVPGDKESPQELTVCIDPRNQSSELQEAVWSDPGMSEQVPEEGKGAKGSRTGAREHEVNLEIAMKLKSALEESGFDVLATRDSAEVSLGSVARAEIANNTGADLFVRICCGESSRNTESGTRTLYPERTSWTEDIYESSKMAAIFIQDELVSAIERPDRDIQAVGDCPALNWSLVPAVQVEVAYLTNPREETLLTDESFQSRAAEGIKNGILRYFEVR